MNLMIELYINMSLSFKMSHLISFGSLLNTDFNRQKMINKVNKIKRVTTKKRVNS